MLSQRLTGVPASGIESVAERLRGLPAERALLMLDIGLGLSSASLRSAMEFFRLGPEAAQHLQADEMRLWGQLGRRFAAVDAELAISFFQASAGVLASLPPRLRGVSLALCDRQAIISTQVAVECFMAGPQLLKQIADARITQRIYDIGYEISRRSATQSAKLLLGAPHTLSFLRQEHVGPIRKPGRLTSSSAGQTDAGSSARRIELIDRALDLTAMFAQRVGGLAAEFFSDLPQTLPDADIELQIQLLKDTRAFFERCGGVALQYFSVAGQILAGIGPRTLKRWTALAQKIAAQGNVAVYNFLKVTPQVMSRLAALGRHQADALSCNVLSVVDEIGEHSLALALECFKSSPAALRMGSIEQFTDWARAGLKLQPINMRQAHAYYALETKTSQQSLRDSTTGLLLDKIVHTLRLYVEGLTGKELSVKPLSNLSLADFPQDARLGDGTTIFLPSVISVFDDGPSNFRLYKALAAHAAGQIEFGTFATNTARLRSILRRVQADFAANASPPEPAAASEPVNYLTVLSCFPQPQMAGRLFTILESGRIDWQLRRHYRGIRRDLDFFQRRLWDHRPPIDSLPPDHAFLELLFQIALGDQITDAARAVYSDDAIRRFEAILQSSIRRPDATVADSLIALHEIYTQAVSPPAQTAEAQPQKHITSEEDDTAGGSMADTQGARDEPGIMVDQEQLPARESDASDQWARLIARHVPSDADSSSTAGDSGPGLDAEEHAYYYDEWDRVLTDYRAKWCRVVEKPSRRGGRQFVEYVRSYYGPLISTIRYQFQLLRPEALKKIRGEIDGEDFDLQAVIDYAIDRRTSGLISERLYVRRLRKQRDVAVSFLLDMSSSTARTVGRSRHFSPGRAPKRIIDIEKEGLVLMSEALEAVGDLYAIQGFTSEGRHMVKFYIVKDFDEAYGPDVESRIGGISYHNNTRLGAAIRHAAARLDQQSAQTKLLIVLSDGRPYDQDYGDSRYAREDTKVALRQARMEGIIPFCITIDRSSEIQLRDMYGEVGYTIIDDVLSLPERLPGIYRRLTG